MDCKYRAAICLFVCWCASGSLAQDRKTKVLNDRVRVQQERYWIYNDLDTGFALAKQTGKPLLVVFRCVPCEHCAQLDEQVVEKDPLVQSLLDRFVCVRIVHANGMDLSLFQYDYDQSWAAFFLNADRTIYGRYGTRSHQTRSDEDVSLEGFAEALQAALELHRQFPLVKQTLAAKRGPAPSVKVPEEFESLKGNYGSKLDYEGQVVKSCIHCHQVGEALRLVHRSAGEAIPEKVLFPYPHPKSLGLIMDPKHKATVKAVTEGSSAQQSGFQAGDQLVSMQGQPLVSIADIQWVLQHAGESAQIETEILRSGKPARVVLKLEPGWRRRGDISWRATSWDLRRMAAGGILFEELSPENRKQLGVDETELALHIKHLGQYPPHDVAKKAGFQKGDVLVELEGRKDRMSETQLLARMLTEKRPGDVVRMTILRGGRRIPLKLPMQ